MAIALMGSQVPGDVSGERYDMRQVIQQAQILRAMGNDARLAILDMLAGCDEINVGSLQKRLDLSQSALSQHLAVLRRCELVATRRKSQTIYYRLDDRRVTEIMTVLTRSVGYQGPYDA